MSVRYRRVALRAPGWRLDDVAVPLTFRGRLSGLRRRRVHAILLPARSAHTFGVRIPIRMVPLADDGTVARSALVPPRTVRRFPDAAWILEIPASTVPPPRGVRLAVVPSS